MQKRVIPGLVAAALLAPALAHAQAGAKLPDGVTPQMVEAGKAIYSGKGLCFACHGAKAEGAVGPKLVQHEWLHSKGTYPEIVAFIKKGVTPAEAKYGAKSGMPAKGGSAITDEEVNQVAAYIYTISRK